MVRVYSATSIVQLELLETAFRAHEVPYVVRYKMRYMEPTFAGDELRMSHLLVPASRAARAQALLIGLGLAENEDAARS